MATEPTNPLREIFGYSKGIFWVLLFLFVIFEGVGVFFKLNAQSEYSTIFNTLSEDIKSLSIEVFIFLRPFLQLIIILLILEWILRKLGISFTSPNFKLEWNVQSLIAILIISAFTIGALAGVSNAGSLKDLALVVVGFYFGTQKKVTSTTKDGESNIVMTEHTNPPKPDNK
ncbi:hypothetical protein [Runella salmonicolor]|uniref:Uncharacterized protein n=1 Tax=Runella salmonicolor TaxID=2950278 RepID=A0ABT1FRT9_9BACT|nr:hypothetical protein [Runella salmonicolor]MCP1384431.1 hypothetical protein [Runella salmonicolor]